MRLKVSEERLSLSDKLGRLGQRMRDPQWRKYAG